MDKRPFDLTDEVSVGIGFEHFNPDALNVILWIHGLGSSAEVAFQQVFAHEALAELGHYRFDFFGFGTSTTWRPEDSSFYELSCHTGLLDEIVQKLLGKGHRIHMVALGWGAAIAMGLRLDVLERLTSFTSLDGQLLVADLGVARRVLDFPEEAYVDGLPDLLRSEMKANPSFDLDRLTPAALFHGARSLAEVTGDTGLVEKLILTASIRSTFFISSCLEVPIRSSAVELLSPPYPLGRHFVQMQTFYNCSYCPTIEQPDTVARIVWEIIKQAKVDDSELQGALF